MVDAAFHARYRELFASVSEDTAARIHEVVFITRDGRRIAAEGRESCRFVDGVPAITRALGVGGPPAPREPWDPSLSDAERAESEGFWSEHALSR